MKPFIYSRYYIASEEERNLSSEYDVPLFLFLYEAKNYAKTTPTMHQHPFTEIFYIVSGDGNMYYSDKVIPLKKDGLYIIPKGVEHCEACSKDGKPLTFFVINVDNSFPFRKTKNEIPESTALNYVFSSSNNPVHYIFQKVAEDLKAQPQPSQCHYGVQLLLSQLYLEIGRLLAPPIEEKKSHDNNSISFVLSYILEHYAEDLTLQYLADLIHVSTVQLGRMFKKTYKFTPLQFLTNERIFHAKQLLRETNHSITDISIMVGYNSPAYFTSVFHNAVGKTPSEYRNSVD